MGKKGREEAGEEKAEDKNHEIVNGENKKKKKMKNKKSQTQDAAQKKEIPTVSIAVPGSIIDNAQSLELATRLAGQIARAATIFSIDEIIVFDNKGTCVDNSGFTAAEDAEDTDNGAKFLIRILQYLETPQYLRRSLFSKHVSLKFVGLLPPLDAPHHARKHEWVPYREGITLKEKPANSMGTLVDVGLCKNVVVDQVLEPGVRVTVAMGTNRHLETDYLHKVVTSFKPRETGLYWGYKVRYAPNINSVFRGCPYEGGYDHTIGTSEHGLIVNSSELTIPKFRCWNVIMGMEEIVEMKWVLKNNKEGSIAYTVGDAIPWFPKRFEEVAMELRVVIDQGFQV
ncbi:methyltransferase C9orf114 protein isoform X2 [Tasmannia lanceolata]|uniref:methyltransferase C9orf114 protein isoform X2 n=1 Tax=Tasmannia lanceolata TaxID=3420 RepID=UPI004062BB0B